MSEKNHFGWRVCIFVFLLSLPAISTMAEHCDDKRACEYKLIGRGGRYGTPTYQECVRDYDNKAGTCWKIADRADAQEICEENNGKWNSETSRCDQGTPKTRNQGFTPPPGTGGNSQPDTDDSQPDTENSFIASTLVQPAATRTRIQPSTRWLPIRITEYMIHDCNTPCGTRLPQWIEIHNPNPSDFQVEGYKLYYAKNRDEINDTPVAFSIKIPANGAIILATHNRRSSSTPISGGIEDAHVKVLNIPNTLGYGWKITDKDNTVIHQIGDLFTGIKYSAPFYHKPGRVNGYRQSTKVIASEAPTEKRYFGFIHDVSHPTFHKDRVGVAAAPATPFRHRVLTTTWASLRKRH